MPNKTILQSILTVLAVIISAPIFADYERIELTAMVNSALEENDPGYKLSMNWRFKNVFGLTLGTTGGGRIKTELKDGNTTYTYRLPTTATYLGISISANQTLLDKFKFKNSVETGVNFSMTKALDANGKTLVNYGDANSYLTASSKFFINPRWGIKVDGTYHINHKLYNNEFFVGIGASIQFY